MRERRYVASRLELWVLVVLALLAGGFYGFMLGVLVVR